MYDCEGLIHQKLKAHGKYLSEDAHAWFKKVVGDTFWTSMKTKPKVAWNGYQRQNVLDVLLAVCTDAAQSSPGKLEITYAVAVAAYARRSCIRPKEPEVQDIWCN